MTGSQDTEKPPEGQGPESAEKKNPTSSNDEKARIETHSDHGTVQTENGAVNLAVDIEEMIRLETLRQIDAAWKAQRRMMMAYVGKQQQE